MNLGQLELDLGAQSNESNKYKKISDKKTRKLDETGKKESFFDVIGSFVSLSNNISRVMFV